MEGEAGPGGADSVPQTDTKPRADAAGGAPIAGLDGRSFLNVLLGKTDEHRDYVFGVHTNTPEGAPYPIRAIRDRRYKLIVNLLYEKPFKAKYVNNKWNAMWMSWVERAKSDEHAAMIIDRYQQRPAIEFYDLEQDPYELNNLAGDPEYAGVIDKMRGELDAWMKSQGDTGADTDS